MAQQTRPLQDWFDATEHHNIITTSPHVFTTGICCGGFVSVGPDNLTVINELSFAALDHTVAFFWADFL